MEEKREEKREESIGAIWEKTAKNGQPYYSGTVTVDGVEVRFVAFKNRKKEGNQPDWRILESKPASNHQDTRPEPPKQEAKANAPDEDYCPF